MHSIQSRTMNKNTGFTLIEVLIAMLVLAVGLLGMAGLQATSLGNNQSAYNRSQATQLAYDMADRMRANVADAGLLAGSAYLGAVPAASIAGCTAVAGCTPAQMAQNDLFEWNRDIGNTLPTSPAALATGTIVLAGTVFTITINWDDNRDGDADGNGGALEGDTDVDGDTDDDPFFQTSFQL